MSINLKISDTCNNPFLGSYNNCIKLGTKHISRIFNFNIEENENHFLLTEILKGNLGPDSIPEIKNIIIKLTNDELLNREDQIVLGMAYIFYQQIQPAKKERSLAPVKEADFTKHPMHSKFKNPANKLLSNLSQQKVNPHPTKRPPLTHGKSRLRETSDLDM
jgi:hypothetical protein